MKKLERLNFRANKKKYLIYPENELLDFWNMILVITIICIAIFSPYRIALTGFEMDKGFWLWVNRIIDIIFFIDILLTFNSAVYDEHVDIIEERKEIARRYIRTWFFVDLISIIPFELFLGNINDMNSMIKIVRIGRLYKLMKLSKLLKLFKIIQMRSKLLQYLSEIISISSGA